MRRAATAFLVAGLVLFALVRQAWEGGDPRDTLCLFLFLCACLGGGVAFARQALRQARESELAERQRERAERGTLPLCDRPHGADPPLAYLSG